jgi:transcriptional regulator with XRE-family HTH domain
MPNERRLGAFLTARRKLTPPEQVGLQVDGRRYASGLRREEVAQLADISYDYYIRIEQGRIPRPSPQVLDALALALDLDAEATEYLHRLANPSICPRTVTDQVEPTVSRLIQKLDWPAYVVNRRMDVLAENRLAAALHHGLEYNDNFLRMIFLNPAAQEVLPEWEQEAAVYAAHLRAAVGVRLSFASELIDELSSKSKRFHQLWTRHDVRLRKPAPLRLHYRNVGKMTLQRQQLLTIDTPGQYILMCKPVGSESEKVLSSLASSQN